MKKLHHIGIASKDIDSDARFFYNFGYTSKMPAQEYADIGIKVQFISARGQPDIELVQNLVPGEGPMSAHLKAKRKIFHFAYVVDDIESEAKRLVDDGEAMLLVPIQHSVSDNSDICAWCYLYFKNMMIIELVQIKGTCHG